MSLSASAPPGQTPNLVVGIFVAPAIFDFFVTAITLGRAVQLWRDGLRSSWLQFFVREGMIYFIVLTTLNIGKRIHWYIQLKIDAYIGLSLLPSTANMG